MTLRAAVRETEHKRKVCSSRGWQRISAFSLSSSIGNDEGRESSGSAGTARRHWHSRNATRPTCELTSPQQTPLPSLLEFGGQFRSPTFKKGKCEEERLQAVAAGCQEFAQPGEDGMERGDCSQRLGKERLQWESTRMPCRNAHQAAGDTQLSYLQNEGRAVAARSNVMRQRHSLAAEGCN